MDALLFDLDGVFYEGDQPVAGGAETLAWVEERGIPHLFLTNTTSRPRQALVEKLAGFDISVSAERILTPPVAARRWLARHAPGPAALFVPEATCGEFEDVATVTETDDRAAAVVVGDLGESWTYERLNRAFRYLMTDPPGVLVALGMTRYWRAPDGLRLDTAPFVMALAHAAGTQPVVLGKPAQAFFDTALEMLGAKASETVIVGDDIRSDVGGAQDAGLRGVLVKTGKFEPGDLQGDVTPDGVIATIAELPHWWEAQ